VGGTDSGDVQPKNKQKIFSAKFFFGNQTQLNAEIGEAKKKKARGGR